MDLAVVAIKDLHTRLGVEVPINYPEHSLKKPLLEWKMEVDDAPIFRYLYRTFQPSRHLEFGTWRGVGLLYCLEETQATAWTINLLDGETRSDGSWQYYEGIDFPHPSFLSRFLFNPKKHIPVYVPTWSHLKETNSMVTYQTDSLGFIGKYYLEAKFGYRVCQIYCDSREWDISNYPPGFFDTVLIDGGHSPDVVTNDTIKALQLVRPGGLIMWHDFCPQPEVRNSCSSTAGVFEAIKQNWEWLNQQVKDIFWINPSWILVGIKK